MPEYPNHWGNVMAVISDEASTTDKPTIVSLTDYYPFGMTQPGRSYSHPGDDYRFGYTGHEKEKDLAKETYITEFRSLNTQTGRWLSVDPLWMKYPAVGSYVYCMNNPMSLVDIEGADIKIAGKNNSYVVFKTDLININVSAASLGIDWGGQYDLDGEDVLGAALDIVGIFDPTGIADGANALLQAKKGNYFDALISGVGLIPYVGDVAKVGKVKKDVKIIEGAIDAVNKGKKALHFGGRTFYSSQKLAKYKELANHYGGKVADAIWDSGKGGSNKLRDALKLSKGDKRQAHHLIPRELIEKNKTLRDAINEGFEFNGGINGIALNTAKHSGSHPNYTSKIEELIEMAVSNKSLKNSKK